MSHDYHIAPMAEFAERLHRHGAKLAIQLHHPGRQDMASATNSLPFVIPIAERFPGFVDTVFKCTPALLSMEAKGICFSMQAPSKCELSKHGAMRIHAMSKREIHKLIEDFIRGAERCKKAGVDAVELHAGHGYLIQQFLSPNTNLRSDEYGGSFEKRLRFIKEIITGIKERCGRDYPLIVRLTVDDVMSRIAPYGAEFKTGTKLLAVEDGKIVAQDTKTGKNSEMETDYVVLSLGVGPEDGMVKELEKLGVKNVYRVGDAMRSGTIADACHSAYDTACSIR